MSIISGRTETVEATVINIKSGLRQDDYIAFPYGEGVEEGAQTVEVDFLSAVDGGMY